MWQLRTGVFIAAITAMLGGCAAEKDQPAAALPPPEVVVSQVVSRDVTETGEFTGRTDAADSVDIRARVTGYLTQIAFTDGQEVKVGDLLFQIDPRPFKAAFDAAEGQKAQWEAKLARAKADVQRYEKLVPTGAATAQDLDRSKAEVAEAIGAIKSADASIERARLDLEFSQIASPLAGQISKSSIGKGNLVRGDNDLLTTIVALDPMFVNFNVDERTLLQFRERARTSRPAIASQPDVRSMKLPVFVGLANEEGYPHQGVINFSDNRVDPSTGTVLVRATFENADRIFKPGFFVRVRVPLSDAYKALLVVDRAIGTDQGQKFLYVVDDKNIAQYRAVKVGRLEDDGLRVVTEGLKPGDSVVVTGLQRVRPGKPVNPQRVEMPREGAGGETQTVMISSGKDDSAKAATQH